MWFIFLSLFQYYLYAIQYISIGHNIFLFDKYDSIVEPWISVQCICKYKMFYLTHQQVRMK